MTPFLSDDNDGYKCCALPKNKMSHSSTSSNDEQLDTRRIRILSVPSKLSQVVLLQHPASITLHGYVKVTVWFGSVHVFGYNVKEDESISVFSTEATGLKKLDSLRPIHRLDTEALKKELVRLTFHEETELETFLDDIGPSSVVVCVEKLLLPPPLQFLQLYFPAALQTKWARSEEQEKNLKLCSTEETYVLNVDNDSLSLSVQIKDDIKNLGAADFGHRICIKGLKKKGKSCLMQYLINSFLNTVNCVFFLDADPDQTEYTPPGVVSLFKVTKPLLAPPFAHQKKPLNMIFIGSVTPGTSPTLYGQSVVELMKLFNANFKKEILFVSTMGFSHGNRDLCLQSVQAGVKPTIEVEVFGPDPNSSLKKTLKNGIIFYRFPSKAPSRGSGAPAFSSIEKRNFNITAYFGQCQKHYLPVSCINKFQPFRVKWDDVALHVIDKDVPVHLLGSSFNRSVVGLCQVDSSSVLENENSDVPTTLKSNQICECLGFGLVRAIDEKNHLLYIVTPLKLEELKNVNALVKGNIIVPPELLLKQKLKNIELPYVCEPQLATTPGFEDIPERSTQIFGGRNVR